MGKNITLIIDIIGQFSILLAFMILLVQTHKNNKSIISLLTMIVDLKLHINKLTCLIDFVSSCVSNSAVKGIYTCLSEIPVKEFPQTEKEYVKVMSRIITQVNNNGFQRLHTFFMQAIEKTDDESEKMILKTRLQKLSEIKNLTDLLDENATKEHLMHILSELDKSVFELFQDNRNDF